jgi:hypothetical protein
VVSVVEIEVDNVETVEDDSVVEKVEVSVVEIVVDIEDEIVVDLVEDSVLVGGELAEEETGKKQTRSSISPPVQGDCKTLGKAHVRQFVQAQLVWSQSQRHRLYRPIGQPLTTEKNRKNKKNCCIFFPWVIIYFFSCPTQNTRFHLS